MGGSTDIKKKIYKVTPGLMLDTEYESISEIN